MRTVLIAALAAMPVLTRDTLAQTPVFTDDLPITESGVAVTFHLTSNDRASEPVTIRSLVNDNPDVGALTRVGGSPDLMRFEPAAGTRESLTLCGPGGRSRDFSRTTVGGFGVPEHVFTQKTTSQQAAESITLQRTDRLNDIWEDGAGHVFTRNGSGTWILLESPAAYMSPACAGEDSHMCDASADGLAEYNDSIARLRDRLFAGVYTVGEFDDLGEAVSICDTDGDSRTAFLESSGMMWLRGWS